MEPFSVTCETCRSRLNVRDPSLVGEIHGCPKCGGMVMIAMPTAVPETQPAPANPAAPATGLDASRTFEGLDDTLATLDEGPTPEPDETIAGTAEGAETPSIPAVSAPIAAAWTVSRIIWTGAVAGSVLLVATLGVLWALQPSDEGRQRTAPSAANSAVAPDDDAQPANPVGSASDAEPATAETVVAAKPIVEPYQLSDSESPSPPAEMPPDLETTAVVEQLPELPTLPDDTAAESRPEATADNQPPRILDPLALDPVDLDLLLAPRVAVVAAEQPAAPAPLPVANDPAPPTQLAGAEFRYEPGTFVRGPTALETPSDKTLERRLAMPLPELMVNDVPLHALCEHLAATGDFGCTISPRALRMAAVAPDHSVSLTLRNSTLGEALRGLAKKLRLDLRPAGGAVTFEKPGAETRRSHDYKLADLLPIGATDATPLAEMLAECVDGDWQANGAARVSGTTLKVQQALAIQYDTLLFFERMRRARGIVPRSKYPGELLSATPRFTALSDRLARPTTLTLVDYTPLPEALRHVAASNGLAILVDWPSLNQRDISTASLVAGSVFELPLADTLDRICAPLDVVWMPIDDSTLWITTREAVDRFAWIEFYEADSLGVTSVDELRDRLAALVPNEQLADVCFVDDLAHGLIIVRGPVDVHRAAARAGVR